MDGSRTGRARRTGARRRRAAPPRRSGSGEIHGRVPRSNVIPPRCSIAGLMILVVLAAIDSLAARGSLSGRPGFAILLHLGTLPMVHFLGIALVFSPDAGVREANRRPFWRGFLLVGGIAALTNVMASLQSHEWYWRRFVERVLPWTNALALRVTGPGHSLRRPLELGFASTFLTSLQLIPAIIGGLVAAHSVTNRVENAEPRRT